MEWTGAHMLNAGALALVTVTCSRGCGCRGEGVSSWGPWGCGAAQHGEPAGAGSRHWGPGCHTGQGRASQESCGGGLGVRPATVAGAAGLNACEPQRDGKGVGVGGRAEVFRGRGRRREPRVKAGGVRWAHGGHLLWAVSPRAGVTSRPVRMDSGQSPHTSSKTRHGSPAICIMGSTGASLPSCSFKPPAFVKLSPLPGAHSLFPSTSQELLLHLKTAPKSLLPMPSPHAPTESPHSLQVPPHVGLSASQTWPH